MAHLTDEKYIHKSNMLQYLNTFSLEFYKRYPNESLSILIVGGSAIALKDGWRDATVDIDACYTFRGNV